MKYLVMCEGTNELTLIDLLLNADRLKFTRNEIIGQRVYPMKNFTQHPILISELLSYGKPVKVYRIGDKQSDTKNMKIPSIISDIVSRENIFKFCTKPELEILLIINEGLYDKYINHYASKQKPKTFAKGNIIFNGRRYDQTSDFLKEYYSGDRLDLLVENLKRYKKLKKHDKDELYLFDLLK